MKRFLSSALILGAVSGFGLVGCADKAEEKTKVETTTPSGTTTEEISHKVKSTEPGGVAGSPAAGGTTTPATK